MIKYSCKMGVTFAVFFLLISLNNIQAVDKVKKRKKDMWTIL
jgi:hypothetical protein